MRTTLVAALAACAESEVRAKARRFLSGLSSDELQFIAEYFGSCILQSVEELPCCRPAPRRRLDSPDLDHKMIVLAEYLRQTGAATYRPATSGLS